MSIMSSRSIPSDSRNEHQRRRSPHGFPDESGRPDVHRPIRPGQVWSVPFHALPERVRGTARKGEPGMDMIWTGIVKAVDMLVSLDPEICRRPWMTVKITGARHPNRAVRRDPGRARVVGVPFPRKAIDHRPDQHGHGPSSRRRRPVRGPFPVEDGTAGFAPSHLHSGGHGDRPGPHRRPDHRRPFAGGLPERRSLSPPSGPGSRRVEGPGAPRLFRRSHGFPSWPP